MVFKGRRCTLKGKGEEKNPLLAVKSTKRRKKRGTNSGVDRVNFERSRLVGTKGGFRFDQALGVGGKRNKNTAKKRS